MGSYPKGYVVPNRDPSRACEAARQAWRQRRDVLEQIRVGELSIAELRDLRATNHWLDRIHVGDLYRAIGPRWTKRQILYECLAFDLDPKKTIGSLGPAQWHRLIGRLDSMRRPGGG